ncbi:MAG: hypothetical protein OYG31_00740 [Candidatus Kaiserbacteria bacterium]|nr:hypothetical protein [Candidatus Kaiserbacteria bacterium]
MAGCRDVYYYESQFLQKEGDKNHYHIVVADVQVGSDGSPKKLVAIITTHTGDREQFYQQRGGEKSYAIVSPNDYSELTSRSIVSGELYEEDERNLLDSDKKLPVSDAVFEKVREAAGMHKGNKRRIKNQVKQ